jgi:pilus assembly protein FimV
VVWLVIRRRQMRSEALVPGIATETAMAETQAEASPAAAGGETYAPTGGDLLEAEVNEIDPLAEADVYMAYRRYQQAEELLKGAIDQEPNRLELRLKLLEVFAAGENTEAFVSEAENFYNERGGRDNPLWEKVAAMGREVQPEHPLFATEGDVPAGGADAVEDATPVALEDDELEDDELFNTMLEPQSVDEPAASDDVLQSNEPDITEELASIEEEQDEAEEEEQDLAIEFESGLDKKLPERPATEEKSQGGEFKTGFEIDFDTSPGTGATTKARRQGQEAEETLDDALGDAVTSNLEEGLSLDAIDGFEDMEQSSEETGLDFVTDAATPDNNNTPGDGDAGEIQGLESVEEGDTSEQGDTKLDFEFKMGSLATKDKDLEDFFEGLDSVDGGDDGAGGHEEVGTKLDLAKAFIEMGDQDGARDILKEVVDHGNDEQKEEARSLLEQL